jgi:hypothetical protein
VEAEHMLRLLDFPAVTSPLPRPISKLTENKNQIKIKVFIKVLRLFLTAKQDKAELIWPSSASSSSP